MLEAVSLESRSSWTGEDRAIFDALVVVGKVWYVGDDVVVDDVQSNDAAVDGVEADAEDCIDVDGLDPCSTTGREHDTSIFSVRLN